MFPNLSETLSLSREGQQSILIRVEVAIRKGLPVFQILGLASPITKESKDRIRIALESSGFVFPFDAIIVNLQPSHKTKGTSFFDLAICMGILKATGQWEPSSNTELVALGALSLSGEIHGSKELLDLIRAYPKSHGTTFLVPEEIRNETLPTGSYIFIRHLSDLHSNNRSPVSIQLEVPKPKESEECWEEMLLTYDQMKGFQAICYAILGGHHTLIIGNPGTGKTLLARMASAIQPQWSIAELNESETPFHLFDNDGKLKARPFRSPHHTSTEQALVGGGSPLVLGEVSLANGGILFLDELTEFKDRALESLREPLEEGKIYLSRVYHRETLPANFLLIAAMNPCPCGNYNGMRNCHCSKKQMKDYLKKLSGPLIDRIPIHVQLFQKMEARTVKVKRSDILERLEKARIFKENSLGIENQKFLNRDILSEHLPVQELGYLSHRQISNIMRLARTIADFNLSPTISKPNLLEAYEFVQNSLFFEDIK